MKKNKEQARHDRIFKFYLNYWGKEGKKPSMKEISKSENISRQRAHQIVCNMQEEGYFIPLPKKGFPFFPNLSIFLNNIERFTNKNQVK